MKDLAEISFSDQWRSSSLSPSMIAPMNCLGNKFSTSNIMMCDVIHELGGPARKST